MTLILQMETLRYRQVQQLTYSYTFSKRQSWRRKPGSLVPERVVFTRTVHFQKLGKSPNRMAVRARF